MYERLQKPENRKDIIAAKQEKPKTVTRYPYQYSDGFLGASAGHYQNANVPEHNYSEPRSVVQMYKKAAKTFEDEEVIWEPGEEKSFWDTVDAAIPLACARAYMIASRDSESMTGVWAKEIEQILNSRDLVIYPMVSKDRDGQSAYDKWEISLDVNKLNKDIDRMAKTLIHEAFHIIGGCFKMVNGQHVYNAALDTANDSESIDDMYQEMSDARFKLIDVRADTFAQYVMKKGKLEMDKLEKSVQNMKGRRGLRPKK